MKPLRVLARSAEQAIVKIRKAADREDHGTFYVLIRRYFWWVTWVLLCLAIAWHLHRPGAGALMLAAPVGLLLVLRLLRTAPGLVLLAGALAWASCLAVQQTTQVERFLGAATYKFISGQGATIIPHPDDTVRLYAQDDLYVAQRLKKVGDTVKPAECVLVADLSREIRQLAEAEQAIAPMAAHADYLVAQDRRRRKEAQLQLELNALKRKQTAFERAQLERPSGDGRSMMQKYRALLGKGLLPRQEFDAIEKEYERLKSESKRLATERRLLELELAAPPEMDVPGKRLDLEAARVELLGYQAESQRQWLVRTALVRAPSGEANVLLTQLLRASRHAPGGSGASPSEDRAAWERPRSRNGEHDGSADERTPALSRSVPWTATTIRGPFAIDLGGPDLDRLSQEGYQPVAYRNVCRADWESGGGRSREVGDLRPIKGKVWREGKIIYLAGSRLASRVARGELVAEIWTGRQRKRIGISLPRAKLAGVRPGGPVNFLLDEEVSDFDTIVYGTVKKIRQEPGSDSFWIEAGDLSVRGDELTLDHLRLGLSGDYRIGVRPITRKEKYLKVKGEAKGFGEIWASARRYLWQYARRMAGEDFVSGPPGDADTEPSQPRQSVHVFTSPVAQR